MAEKKPKTVNFNDFIMYLHQKGYIPTMTAANLTLSPLTPKKRELFYQMYILELCKQREMYWEHVPLEMRKEVNREILNQSEPDEVFTK